MKFFAGRTRKNTLKMSTPASSELRLKGTGFSPYIHTPTRAWALAPEGNSIQHSSNLFLFLFILAALSCPAQTASPVPAATQTAPAAQLGQAAEPHLGQVIFSRSTDESGQTNPQSAPPATPPSPEASAASEIEREAVAFTAYDLDVHLRPAEQQIAVRALFTVRNEGKSPLTRLPLQLSSSLRWERIRVAAKDAAFQAATVNSDVDHTGQLHEAVVALAEPLVPGASLQIDATYSGAIAANAQRLVAIGAPEEAALRSDWDQIGLAFTGLRGFGSVLWYPVASVPVLLGDGARLFDEIGREKLRLCGSRFRLRLSVEFPHGQAPTVALINGRSVPLTITEASASLDQNQEVTGVASADSGETILGFEAPSLFAAIRSPHPGTNLTAWTLPENEVNVQAWSEAATTVTPFLQSWLGQKPRSPLTLLDLPNPGDAPFEQGSLLAAPLVDSGAKPDLLDGTLVHALTHAWLQPTAQQTPPPAWLDEGVAAFMGSLWVERRHGREAALGTLEADRAALALAEPESPGKGAGQPLATAISPVYYRTKAAYFLWMLRAMAGDQALSAALRTGAASGGFEEQLVKAASPLDIGWLFADWVDADKGLPDLSIDGVYPESGAPGNWLVAVHITNAGYAAAEVPLTVRVAPAPDSDATSVTQRVRIPAHGSLVQRIVVQGKPIEVELNDGVVPESQASVHITSLGNAPSSSGASQPAQPRRRE
jgi:hypothetical protein